MTDPRLTLNSTASAQSYGRTGTIPSSDTSSGVMFAGMGSMHGPLPTDQTRFSQQGGHTFKGGTGELSWLGRVTSFLSPGNLFFGVKTALKTLGQRRMPDFNTPGDIFHNKDQRDKVGLTELLWMGLDLAFLGVSHGIGFPVMMLFPDFFASSKILRSFIKGVHHNAAIKKLHKSGQLPTGGHQPTSGSPPHPHAHPHGHHPHHHHHHHSHPHPPHGGSSGHP